MFNNCLNCRMVCVRGEIKKKTRFERTPTLALVVECFAVKVEINRKIGFERTPRCSACERFSEASGYHIVKPRFFLYLKSLKAKTYWGLENTMKRTTIR